MHTYPLPSVLRGDCLHFGLFFSAFASYVSLRFCPCAVMPIVYVYSASLHMNLFLCSWTCVPQLVNLGTFYENGLVYIGNGLEHYAVDERLHRGLISG